ncbi:MAG TPA: hypothetical protein VFV50_04930, partial [Bdellovibrionales bacterium]|nr:hypothetical protein [Bdellovibrionales bacterium]
MKHFALIALTLTALTATGNPSPWMAENELLGCRVRGIHEDGHLSARLSSSWEGDGIFTRDGHDRVYFTDGQELERPQDSLAMVEFGVGRDIPRYKEEPGYVGVNLEIDTTKDGRLAFYVFQGGHRVRDGEDE